MEVAKPVDLTTFDSGCSTPYVSAPSSPQQRHHLFFSEPSSPSQAAAIFYAHFYRHPSFKDADFSSAPPSPPPSSVMEGNDHQEFEFGLFGGPLEEDKSSFVSAEELFHQGMIKPLKDQGVSFQKEETKDEGFKTRGRDKINYARKKTRSLSPSRVSNILFSAEENNDDRITTTTTSECPAANNASSNSFWGSFSFSRAYRNWRLKNLLFRSASEGHAPREQDAVVSNYVPLPSQNEEVRNSSLRSSGSASCSINRRIDDVKNSSSRSVGSDGSVRSSRRRNGSISAHELHYKVNRAVSEEMKKKTYLPYRKGLMGCAGIDVVVSNAIGSMTR